MESEKETKRKKKEEGHIRRLISREGQRGYGMVAAEEQKGRKGRRNIPMHRAPWHRYCISGTLQSPLPGPVDYLPDNHAAATYLTTYLALRLPNILPPRAPLLKNLDRDVADLITPIVGAGPTEACAYVVLYDVPAGTGVGIGNGYFGDGEINVRHARSRESPISAPFLKPDVGFFNLYILRACHKRIDKTL